VVPAEQTLGQGQNLLAQLRLAQGQFARLQAQRESVQLLPKAIMAW